MKLSVKSFTDNNLLRFRRNMYVYKVKHNGIAPIKNVIGINK